MTAADHDSDLAPERPAPEVRSLEALAADLSARAATRAAGHDRDASFPEADVADWRDAGLLGLLVPERLGGRGATFEQYVAVAMELATGHPASALVFNMHASVTGALAGVPDELVLALGGDERFFAARDRALAAAAGRALYGVAISEAGVGSRLSRLRTSYEPEGDGFRLRGTKSTCSAAGHAAAYLVAARAAGPPDGGGSDGDGAEPVVSHFLVPAGTGVEVVGEWDPLGMRATCSRGLALDCHVGADALLGVEGVAVLLAYAMPQWLVASYAAVYAGLARGAVAEAGRLLAERHGAAGVPPTARSRLGRADATAEAAALAVAHAARRADEDPSDPGTIRWLYRAKLLAGDAAMEVTASLAEACGLSSLRRGDPLERAYRDARFGAIMPPRSDVCAEVLGVDLLGLDPRTALDDPPW